VLAKRPIAPRKERAKMSNIAASSRRIVNLALETAAARNHSCLDIIGVMNVATIKALPLMELLGTEDPLNCESPVAPDEEETISSLYVESIAVWIEQDFSVLCNVVKNCLYQEACRQLSYTEHHSSGSTISAIILAS